MNTPQSAGAPTWSDRAVAAWNRFWFTPADPTVLGLIRICGGLITFYTVLIYSFNLQEFFGKDAWWGLDSALRTARDKAYQTPPLSGYTFTRPADDFQKRYFADYTDRFGGYPLDPYPENQEQYEFSIDFRRIHGFDFRLYHMPFPRTVAEQAYLIDFVERFRTAPAPPYPTTEEELKDVLDFAKRYGVHPNSLYHRGTPVWSIWFHVTDPLAMGLIHGAIVLVTLLFTIGFCTRVTSVLTWMSSLFYIHRSPQVLFGVDTMMTILLLYLMIGPSGAALSVDRRIARLWSKARPMLIARWWAFWRGRPEITIQPDPAPSPNPEASVSANVAIRLLQVHVCIIYLAAGLSKLLGQTWWNGTAVWSTIANYEFAPMQYEIYNWFLRTLGKNEMVFMLFLTTAGYFTLIFEIGYAFLVWRPATRWMMLGMAITLHGFIGLFMGLKTFSMMMLVMNMAFLRPEEARWLLDFWPWRHKKRPATTPKPAPPSAARPAKEAVA